MQIFVRHPSTGKTSVFDCSAETTLQDFVQWIKDCIGWPPYAYYMTRSGRPLAYPYDQMKTFQQLSIEADDTIHLTGRLVPMYQY